MKVYEMTYRQFKKAAMKGKVHQASGVILQDEINEKNPIILGYLNGYSDEDIACFYSLMNGTYMNRKIPFCDLHPSTIKATVIHGAYTGYLLMINHALWGELIDREKHDQMVNYFLLCRSQKLN